MITRIHQLRLAILTALGLSLAGGWTAPANAAAFTNRPLDENRVVAIASPVGSRSHQLLILEQVGNQRQCWRDEGDTIDPLLLDFDFTGICGRGTDSNGYSLRVGNEDLSWRYSLRIDRDGNTLRLLASPNTDRTVPDLEIGTAQLVAGELVEITLNPGWSITKRVYNGQPLGHYYLTHSQSLSSLIAAARPNTPRVPPIMTVRPTPPDSTPDTTSTPAPERTPQPRPVSPNLFDGTPPPPSEHASRIGLSYRVVVPANTLEVQRRIRAIVPDSFRVALDGELMMQVGVFRERIEAEVMRQRLRTYGYIAQILDIPASNNDSPSPAPPPPANPPTQPTNPGTLPTVPNGRYVVVIDPGHGGRDPGAIGIGGLRETDVVIDISRQVATLLQQQGVQVVMTRNGEQFVDLAPRVSIAERANADIFVSIHANAISMSRPEVNGAETYYFSSNAGYRLAQSIQQSILQRTGMGDRGVREARFYVLRNTSMPSALVETGFVTGAQDAPRLRTPTFRTQMAEAIAIGILNYLR